MKYIKASVGKRKFVTGIKELPFHMYYQTGLIEIILQGYTLM